MFAVVVSDATRTSYVADSSKSKSRTHWMMGCTTMMWVRASLEFDYLNTTSSGWPKAALLHEAQTPKLDARAPERVDQLLTGVAVAVGRRCPYASRTTTMRSGCVRWPVVV